MAAAPPVLPAPACGGSVERRPEVPAGRGSSLLATATRQASLQQEGSRGAAARAPKLLLAWAAATAAWIAARFDF